MAPKYKLIYFNVTGRGEPIRLLLSYGGLEFEDSRFEFADWPKVKQTLPLGQAPVLEIDGKPYTQTIPICQYLAGILNLNGKTPLENLVIDAVFPMLWDVLETAYKIGLEADSAKKEKLSEQLNSLLPAVLGKLEADTKNNGGYIAVNRLTWADIVFLSSYESIKSFAGLDVFDKYPNLLKLKDTLLQIPNLRNYIQKKPTNAMEKFNLKSEL